MRSPLLKSVGDQLELVAKWVATNALPFVVAIMHCGSTLHAQKFDPAETELMKRVTQMEQDKWPYSRLAKEADVVIIGIFKKEIDGTDCARADGDIVVSRFLVLAVVHGEAESRKEIDVRHRRPVESVGICAFESLKRTLLVPSGSPVFVENELVDYVGPLITSAITPEYMLFLRRREDDIFEPVSGFEQQNRSLYIINK